MMDPDSQLKFSCESGFQLYNICKLFITKNGYRDLMGQQGINFSEGNIFRLVFYPVNNYDVI